MKKISLSIFFMVLFTLSFGQTYDAELVENKTDVTVSNGNLTQNQYFEIKINNRQGENFTEINIPFSRINKISKIEAYIKDSKGEVVRKLKNNEISEKSNISDFSLYEDDFVKEFTLKYNEYPYYICYSYQMQRNEFIDIENWIPVIDSEVPTLNAELNLTIPKDYTIRYNSKFVDQPSIKSSDKTTTYHWKTTYNQNLQSEKFTPPLTESLPLVVVIPNEFKYAAKGNFQDWKTYSSWAFQLIKDKNQLTEEEKIKITSLISGISNETEKIKTLYHYLQDNTRYINVTINTGGIVPYPASYVCENKYGDCKALTNYFKSLLDFVGIKSVYTFVHAGEVISNIDKNFPEDKFNHIILFIPRNDTIWLDCTSKGPFNYLGTFTQNRYALSIDETNGELVRTPKLNPEDVLETRNISVEYKKDEVAKISFDNICRGKLFDRIESLNTSFNAKDKDDIIRENFMQEGLEMIDYNIVKKQRDDRFIRFIYHAASNNIYKKYGNEIILNNINFDIPNIERPSERKLPVQINYPINKADTIKYNIPQGYELSNKPTDIIIEEFPYGAYSIKFKVDETSVQVTKKMLINAGRYPLSEYQKFYDFCNKILNFEKGKYIILKSKN